MMNVLPKPANVTTILLVDDMQDNLRLLTKILELNGYLVRKALNGKMALRSIFRDPPDLILLDIMMPNMDGFEICQQLKSYPETADIPVMFVSALDSVEDKVHAFKAGGQDYITKPFHELEVLMRVRNQLLIRQQQRQLVQQNQQLQQEIKERLKAETKVRQLALTDEMTGLHNRRGFFLLAEQQLKIVQRTQTPCYLLFADVDGLKLVNDMQGHPAGDRLIRNAAHVLQQTFRNADIIGRLGGDEFAVLILSVAPDVDEFGARLQSNIDSFNQTTPQPYPLSMSVGIHHCIPADSVTLTELITQADRLMYAQKLTRHSATQNPQNSRPIEAFN